MIAECELQFAPQVDNELDKFLCGARAMRLAL
jgi:hypothetical protein